MSEPGYTGQRALTCAAGDMYTDVDEQRLGEAANGVLPAENWLK